MSRLTLDAGALIGFGRGDRRAVAIMARVRERGHRLSIPAGVLGQVWRDGRRQSRLARLLGSSACDVVALDERAARAAGQLRGVTGTDDVVDASVVLYARSRGESIATCDPLDLRRLDARIVLLAV